MSAGHVYLSVFLTQELSNTQVAATLQRVDAQGRLAPGTSIVIPVRSGAPWSTRVLDLEPGLYAVEAVLPSGQRASEVFELAADQDLPIVLEPAFASPHEWMFWETFAGLVERQAYDEVAGGDLSGYPPFEVVWHEGKRILDWDNLDTAILNSTPITFEGPPLEGPWFHRKERDRLAQEIFVRSMGTPAVCVARAGRAMTLQPVVTDGTYRIVMFGAPADRSIRSWMTTLDGDPIIRSALAYQARGATQAAKAIFQENRNLFGKGMPGGLRDSCAILYVYLHDREGLWFDPRPWLEAQCQSSTLADVHILSAWYRLLAPTTAEHLQLAEDDLRRAYSCGLPAFSQGVRLLRDGLALIGADGASEWSRIVRRVARRVDFTQPFTSVRLASAAARLDDSTGATL